MIKESFNKLKNYCEKEQFKGWDPYDGLNSKLIKFTPFKYNSYLRIVWIQIFKKNPINLRKLFLVPKGYNSKAIALFLTGYCNLYKSSNNNEFCTKEEIQEKIIFLSDLLIKIQSKGYLGSCWGYNFDWQSRAFFLPKNTPTVVVTSFVVDALLSAYEITKNEIYKETAISSSNFILNDLNRIEKEDNTYMFSYSPIDNQAVYNASLLGAKTLSLIYSYTKDEILKVEAKKNVQAVCNTQHGNGAFPHSDQVGDKWRDNFHTGFKLESIKYYSKYCKDNSFDKNIEKGFLYWKENFFLEDGTAKYYDNSTYPIDLHCAAQSLSTFYKLNKFDSNLNLIELIINWAITNMQNPKGYFNFQMNSNKKINKIEYLRWPNAWMFYGMSYYLLKQNNNENN